jgi:hypothetical protein
MHDDLSSLSALPSLVTDSKKENYRLCVEGLRRFTEKYRVTWISEPSCIIWTSQELEVRVNPELLGTIDGDLYAMKLYLRGKRLKRLAKRTMLHLMQETHGRVSQSRAAIIDVRRSELLVVGGTGSNIETLLHGEAAAFIAMWKAAA